MKFPNKNALFIIIFKVIRVQDIKILFYKEEEKN